jgi:hypothetical protein
VSRSEAGHYPLEDRTVLVTGGNGGIGLGIAAAVGRAGAQVVIWGRKATKNEAAVEQLNSEGITAIALECDIDDEDQVATAFAASVEAVGGRIDTVFANAATTGRGESVLELSLAEWRRVTKPRSTDESRVR